MTESVIYFIVPIVLLFGGVTALFFPGYTLRGAGLCLSGVAIGSALWYAAPTTTGQVAFYFTMGKIVISMIVGAMLGGICLFLKKPQ